MALGPQLQSILTRYGLQSLIPWASQAIIADLSPEEFQLKLFDRPEYQAAFPEIEARRKKAEATGVHMAPISAEDILNYRAQARAMMRGRGVPADMYGQDADFRELIENDVSLDELNSRLDFAEARVWQAPPQVREVFNELMGLGVDDTRGLFNIFLDIDRAIPSLENLVQRAEAGGAARRFGFNLSWTEMDRMQQANIDYQGALEGFAELDVRRSLFDESLYETEDYTVGEEGIEAVFGLEGGAGEKLTRRAETRTASTAGQAGGLVEERGATGLGGAGRR
jgi:hypothetical protein